MNPTIIIDFDSTFVKYETLDLLAKIIYKDSSVLDKILSQVEAETKACMAGEKSIHESLVKRVELLNIKRVHVEAVIDFLKQNISDSFMRNQDFIKRNASNIFIFSGGFKEVIDPVAANFNISSANVYANQFIYDNHTVVGIDEDCPMAHNLGKAKQLKALKRNGPVFVLGDGATDAEIKESDKEVKFFLFAENVLRENLLPQADSVIQSFDEFIKIFEHR